MLVILLSFLNTLQERQKTLKVKNNISYLRQSFEVGVGQGTHLGLQQSATDRALAEGKIQKCWRLFVLRTYRTTQVYVH